ncbi:putative membrane protein [Lactococcus lactis subsp. lactis bv. diacetylactis]|nr:putative membrane protein [Lactococcus lactis subsp. lactis bv. diacetylactis]
MLVLCAVDVLMIILTLLEYRKLKAHISKEGSYSSLKNSKVN